MCFSVEFSSLKFVHTPIFHIKTWLKNNVVDVAMLISKALVFFFLLVQELFS